VNDVAPELKNHDKNMKLNFTRIINCSENKNLKTYILTLGVLGFKNLQNLFFFRTNFPACHRLEKKTTDKW